MKSIFTLLALVISFQASAQVIFEKENLKDGSVISVSTEKTPVFVLDGKATVSDASVPVGRQVIIYPKPNSVLLPKGTKFVSMLDASLQTGEIVMGGKPVWLVKLDKGETEIWCGDCKNKVVKKDIKKPVVKAPVKATAGTSEIKGSGYIGNSKKNWKIKKGPFKVGQTIKYSFEVVSVSGKGKLYVGVGFDGKYNYYTPAKKKVSGSIKILKERDNMFVIGAAEGTTYRIKNLVVK